MTNTSSSINFPYEQAPNPGELVEIAEGIFWIRMPMPFALDHINLWLLEEEHQWTVVDSGLATDAIVEIWEDIFENHLKGKPIKRVICTHMHPDHVGLAGWLCKRDKGILHMSLAEYTYCRTLLAEKGREAPDEAIAFYRSAGFTKEEIFHYSAHFGWFGKLVKALPHQFKRLEQDDTIKIGSHQWRVLVGRGHSPEHVCLYNEKLKLVISGDQILPNISSNISVWPMEPFSNPLKQWLQSCEFLKQVIGNDVTVLPAHGLPFIGAKHRLQALIDEHNEDLDKLEQFCDVPRTVVEGFPVLFKAKIDKNNRIMATGESFAHFNYLLESGRVTEQINEQGVKHFTRVK
ncbi:MBL fold metallo-hydrolase [Thalassotalea atypica]|uniref:MBL fold metallo-hydrolase n=1 Tax=Thalassotalea atypica TaxID=2054316 RepID=UPI002572C331|nr:MBL fold metallo-hydrolase [Thalassotalea atypica]